jgi:hypothetical protein
MAVVTGIVVIVVVIVVLIVVAIVLIVAASSHSRYWRQRIRIVATGRLPSSSFALSTLTGTARSPRPSSQVPCVCSHSALPASVMACEWRLLLCTRQPPRNAQRREMMVVAVVRLVRVVVVVVVVVVGLVVVVVVVVVYIVGTQSKGPRPLLQLPQQAVGSGRSRHA